jgi:uncharacterized phiE125 gp8 family phage protein
VYGLTAIAGPEEEPVSLGEAKAHLRLDPDYHGEDAAVARAISSARELAEAYTGRRWATQQLRLTLPGWPRDRLVRLPVEPVASVDAVKYYAADGTLTTLAAGTDYQAWLDHSPPLVMPAPLGVWPASQVGRAGSVVVEFTAGTATAAAPSSLRSAILLLVEQEYERYAAGGPNGAADRASLGMPPGAKRLLDLLSTGSYA